MVNLITDNFEEVVQHIKNHFKEIKNEDNKGNVLIVNMKLLLPIIKDKGNNEKILYNFVYSVDSVKKETYKENTKEDYTFFNFIGPVKNFV